MKIMYKVLFFVTSLIVMAALSYSDQIWQGLTKGQADSLYCAINSCSGSSGGGVFSSLDEIYLNNVSNTATFNETKSNATNKNIMLNSNLTIRNQTNTFTQENIMQDTLKIGSTLNKVRLNITDTSGNTVGWLDQYGGLRTPFVTGAYIGQTGSQNNAGYGFNTTGSYNAVSAQYDRLRGGGYRYTHTLAGWVSNTCFSSVLDNSGTCRINAANPNATWIIDFNPYVNWTADSASGYTYGTGIVVINFFSNSMPQNLTLEAYQLSGTDKWTTIVNYTTPAQAQKNPLVITVPSIVYVKKLRLSIGVQRPINDTRITGFEYFPYLPTNTREMTYIPRHSTEDTIITTGLFRFDNGSGVPKTILHMDVANSATAVAYELNTNNNLATAGAKILSLKNYDSEMFYVQSNGSVWAAGAYTGDDFIVGTDVYTGSNALAELKSSAQLIADGKINHSAFGYATVRVQVGTKIAGIDGFDIEQKDVCLPDPKDPLRQICGIINITAPRYVYEPVYEDRVSLSKLTALYMASLQQVRDEYLTKITKICKNSPALCQ